MRRRADDGFTVLELLIAMMIMGIIMAPLLTSFVLGLRTTIESQQDSTNSSDAQLVSAYFDIDVASSDSVRTNASCGSDSGLVLEWSDGATPYTVTYTCSTDSAMQAELGLSTTVWKLERTEVAGAATQTATVARSLTTPPTITCKPTACSSTASTPRTVSLELVEHTPLIRDAGTDSSFTFGITATRKVTP